MKSINNCLTGKMILIGLVVIFAASPAPAIPPDPDNAALLYYQGFLSLAELDEDARDHIAEVARGEAAPDDKVRQDIRKCKGAIEFAEAADHAYYCHWGVRYSKGFECLLPQMAQARFLTFVLVADARIRAADGDYKGALERSLMTGRFARHIGDDTTITYLVSLSVRSLSYKCMREVMSMASGDEKLLEWFRNELVTSESYTLSVVRPLNIEIELVTDLMRMDNAGKLSRVLTDSGIGIATDSNEKKVDEIVKAINAKTLEQAERIYSERMNSALVLLSTSLPFESVDAQLKQLADNFDPNNPAEALAGTFVPSFSKIYNQETMRRTSLNATLTAVEICLSRIKTGKLPDELPDGLPKDLFSGKDFMYQKIAAGFVLRCPGKDSDIYKFEFKVKK
ncbi:MAG: hypothetical protein JW715_15360 [Sedimentisphaerales bacterium]|nr:hypothetical protein [Sedimentisphaerales bacterium]